MMNPGEHETGFREVDLRYTELKRQHDAGTISDEEFDTQLKQMMVRDDEDRWWAKSRKTGNWHYHDGEAWVQDTPPGYGPPPTLPEESTSDRLRLERSPSSPGSPSDNAPVGDRNERKQRRGLSRWAILAAGLVGIVALAGIWIVMGGRGAPPEEEAGRPAPGYALFEHDSGTLSVEVPSEWDERVVVDEAGEKGRSSWSAFLGEGASLGPSMTAVNDLNSWRNGIPGHQGVYMVASKELAQRYTDDELFASGPNDYSSSCEAGTPRDFDRPPYSGMIQEWENCGRDSEHTAVVVAAAPEDRECVVVLQIGGYLQDQEEGVQHVLDTFEADCAEIA